MKLSKLFHTLYATVMALPVLVIPIFALNILHKETEPISIEVQENKIVDFNQLVSYMPSPNYTINNSNIEYTSTNTGNTRYVRFSETIDFIDTHIYLMQLIVNEKIGDVPSTFNINISNSTLGYPAVTESQQYYRLTSNTTATAFAQMTIPNGYNATIKFAFNIFDLTQMYGSGNEPSSIEFKTYFPNDYYDYTLSKDVLVPDVTTTYNDTDIGSQFVYALYKPVHDYFNFGEFFGLNGMYNWFQLNIFNGTAPLSFFIVFNVMIYWLFISLFWLLFDILIYVPMIIHKWLDKAEM